MSDRQMKPGYRRYTRKYVEVGRYSFLQLKNGDTVSVGLLTTEDGGWMDLGMSFEPLRPEEGMRGYPPSHTGLSIKQWGEHCELVKAALEPLGGLGVFEKLPFETVYIRKSDSRFVSEEEALEPEVA